MAEVGEKPSLTIVRRFKAAPEKVWCALTQPEALKQWMAPSDEFKVAEKETPAMAITAKRKSAPAAMHSVRFPGESADYRKARDKLLKAEIE